MRISVIDPVVGLDLGHSRAYFEEHRSADVAVEVVAIDEGPASIESDLDIVSAAPAIVRRAREAAAGGADAVVINCFADPALFAHHH